MKEYKLNTFDIQLCAEGDGSGGDSGQQTSQTTTAQPATEQTLTQSVQSPEPSEQQLIMDDNGDIYLPEEIEVPQAIEVNQQQQPEQQTTQPDKQPQGEGVTNDDTSSNNEPEAPVPYTPQEIAQIGIDNLDPDRVPAEFKPFYDDYNRRVAEISDKQRTLDALTVALQQPKQQQHPEQQAENNQQPNTDQDDLIHAEAVAKFQQKYGRAPDFYDPEGKDITRFQAVVGQVFKTVEEYRSQESSKQQVKTEFETMMNGFSDKDKNFKTVLDFAVKRADELPWKEARPLMEAYGRIEAGNATSGDVKVIETYIAKSREAYYAGKVQQPKGTTVTKPTQEPPKVESPGSGQSMPNQKLDPSTMPSDADGQIDWLDKYFAQ